MKTASSAARRAVAIVGLVAMSQFPGALNAAIITDGAFNFRETRFHQPLDFTLNPDVIVVGLEVFDSATGQPPPGAIVNAINRNTGRIVNLRRTGVREYSAAVEYSPGLADGQWEVVVQSDTGNATGFVLPAFGSGQGTGPVPGVGNLSVQSGATPTLDWALPIDLPSANDGNVDRLRIRVQDSNYSLLQDQRLASPDSLDDTSFAVPAGVVTHDGLYYGQVLVEGFAPYIRSRTFEPFIVDGVGTGGDPVDVTTTFVFRDHRGPNSVRFGQGDLGTVGVNVDPSDTGGTFAFAEQSGSLLALSQANDLPTEFSGSFNFDPALSEQWTITLNNGEHETVVQTQSIAGAGLLPLVRNVGLIANDTTPTLMWDLPASGEPFTSVQIGLFDDVTDFRIPIGPGGSLFDTLAPTATSYTFDDGVLEKGKRYVARVILSNNPGGGTTNRSISFLNFTPIAGAGTDPVFLPSVDADGTFHFDIDVEALIPVVLDPFVAVGYEFATGGGGPNFYSVVLPQVGDDDDFMIQFLDGLTLVEDALMAGIEYLFPIGGVDAFTVLGIDPAEGLDPGDVTAFMATVKFVADGQFTGTMTPIQAFVPSAVPEPGSLAVLALGLALLTVARRQSPREPGHRGG